MERRLLSFAKMFYGASHIGDEININSFSSLDVFLDAMKEVVIHEANKEMCIMSSDIPKNPVHTAVYLATENPGIVVSNDGDENKLRILRTSDASNAPLKFSYKREHAKNSQMKPEQVSKKKKKAYENTCKFLEKKKKRQGNVKSKPRKQISDGVGAQVDVPDIDDNMVIGTSPPNGTILCCNSEEGAEEIYKDGERNVSHNEGDPDVCVGKNVPVGDSDVCEENSPVDGTNDCVEQNGVHESTEITQNLEISKDAVQCTSDSTTTTSTPGTVDVVYHANPTTHARFLSALQSLELEHEIEDVVLNRCNRSDSFKIVHGPPGTGKTTELVLSLKEWLRSNPNGRCLVTAPTNVAVVNAYDRAVRNCIRSHLFMSQKHVTPDIVVSTKTCAKVAQVVFCTACGRWSDSLCDEGFDAVFIDEAAQLCEAQTLTLLHNVSFVYLTGDPRQLSAYVSLEGARRGYDISLMERLIQHGFECTILKTQKRMHESICEFPNRKFYDSMLKTEVSFGFINFPYCVINVPGVEKKKRTSAYNREEVQFCSNVCSYDSHLETAVLVPYTAQMSEMYREGSFSCLVHTVDSFQGREADRVVLSITRTKSDGFWSNPARLNVALTRAKKKMIILMNVDAWKGKDTLLGELARNACERGVCMTQDQWQILQEER